MPSVHGAPSFFCLLYLDLIRWGIYLQAMNAIGGRDEANINKARSERNLLYPIPADEINVNDSISSNNPGWN